MFEGRFLQSLHFKIASAVIATIVVTSSLYFVVDYRSTRRQLLAELEESAQQLAAITGQGLLELAMVGKHPELMQPAMERLSENSSVERILLLDLEGVVHFASDPRDLGRRFQPSDEGCRECHSSDSPPAGSLFLETDARQTLRSVRLIPNRLECHGCHGASRENNGILVIDFPTEEVWRRLRGNLYQGLYRAATTVLLTLIVLGLVINKLVILPLGRLRRATGALAAGEPSSKVEALAGSGEIGELAASFERMADQVRTSIAELRSQQDYLQSLMDSLPDALIVVDRDLRVEAANRGTDQFWDPQRVRAILQPGGPLEEVRDSVLETFDSGRTDVREVKWAAKGHQEEACLEVNCAPVVTASGEVDRVILWIRDVTQRKLFEAQVSRADRLASVGRLAAGFAHEINNPMAAITTCVEGLDRHLASSARIDPGEKAEIRDYLTTVGEAARRCKEITGRLLSASADRGAGRRETVDLWILMRDAVRLLEHHSRRQGVYIDLRREAEGRMRGSSEKLSQLLLNLLLNALEASREGGTVDVFLAGDEASLLLEVSDNGCGIAAGDLERIFDPFFTTKTEGRGTGLGLFISQWIVRQHEGAIRVRSQEGKGTTFSITFPRHPEELQ